VPGWAGQFSHADRFADAHIPVCSGHVDVSVCCRNVQILVGTFSQVTMGEGERRS
jgi:hypothetical protein